MLWVQRGFKASIANKLEQVASYCITCNSSSDAERGWETSSAIRGGGFVRLTGAMVCLHAAPPVFVS